MPSVARMNDHWTGICCCHIKPPCVQMGGFIITASGGHKSSGPGVARLLDMTIGYCGHTGFIVTSSLKNKTNSRGKVLVGSNVSGCNNGKVVTGDTKHLSS